MGKLWETHQKKMGKPSIKYCKDCGFSKTKRQMTQFDRPCRRFSQPLPCHLFVFHRVSPTAGDHSGGLRRGQKLYRLLAFPNDGSLGIFHTKIPEKSQMFPVSHRFSCSCWISGPKKSVSFWNPNGFSPFPGCMTWGSYILIFPLDTPAIRESIPAPKKKILPLKLTAHP